MKQSTFRRGFRSVVRFLLGGVALAAVAGVGAMSSSAAGTPAFNNLSNDWATLQVGTSASGWGSTASVNPGDTVSMIIWDHQTNPDVTASNVQMKVSLPTGTAASQTATATVWADGAQAATGSVSVTGANGAPISLSYVPGSAQFYRCQPDGSGACSGLVLSSFPAGVNSDTLATTGINLGSQGGCWQYSQAVKFQVKINGGSPVILTNKRVSVQSHEFTTADTSTPGNIVQYRVFLQNTGTGIGKNPWIIDTLDNHLTYVPGSSILVFKQNGSDMQAAIPDSNIKIETISGQTRLSYLLTDMDARADAAVYLLFNAKLKDASAFPTGQTTTVPNCAYASFDTVSPVQTNCVTVTVNNPVAPVVSFNLHKQIQDLTIGDTAWHDSMTVTPGDQVAYSLTLTNTGNTTANTVALKDILPTGVSFIGNVKLYNSTVTGQPINNSSIVSGDGYVFPTLAAGNGNAQTIIFTAQVTNNCSGQMQLDNKSVALYQGAQVAESHAIATMACSRGVILKKEVAGPNDPTHFGTTIPAVHEGQVLTYRIQVINNGNTQIFNPRIVDQLPANGIYVPGSFAIDGEFQPDDIATGVLNGSRTLTDLRPGITKTLTYQVQIPACPPLGDSHLVNTAHLTVDNLPAQDATVDVTIHVNKPVFSALP